MLKENAVNIIMGKNMQKFFLQFFSESNGKFLRLLFLFSGMRFFNEPDNLRLCTHNLKSLLEYFHSGVL